ncbi:MAG: VWA domain-containing protein [Chloroflexi bacterium]|nr:VWA domain-containing protein [Chloroflexota bacterium]
MIYKLRHLPAIFILSALWLSIGALPGAAQQRVKVQLAFVIDGSTSMNSGGMDLFWPVLQGIANGIQDRSLVPRDGSVEVTVVQFGVGEHGVQARVEVPPTVITQQNIVQLGAAIRNIQQGFGSTPTAEGIRLATQMVTSSPHFAEAEFQVINIATDGMPNDPIRFPANPYQGALQEALAASAEAKAAGIDELDAELLGELGKSPEQISFFQNAVFPQPPVMVPPGPIRGGFVHKIIDPADFVIAIHEKLLIVLYPSPTPTATFTQTPLPTLTPTPTATRTPTLTPEPTATRTPTATPTPDLAVPEPTSLALLAGGLAALSGWLGRAKWRRRARRREDE